MTARHIAKAALAVLLLGTITCTTPMRLAAEEVAYWPEDEDDKRLQKLDNQVLQLQKARSQAIFAEDHTKIELLEKQFKNAQKDRRQLLQKTGRR